jgi:glutamine amidotransferase
MIRIINYKRGNLNNVLKAFLNYGFKAEIVDTPDKVHLSDGVVLPGVGAFSDAIKTINETGFADAIKNYVKTGKPFLGICLGLQLLFEESHEFGITKGLGILKGSVKKFEHKDNLKVPHMGWNQIKIKKDTPYFKGVSDNSYFYFVHSYYIDPADKNVILSTTNYGGDFASSVCKDNIVATQFHIEKSQETGLKVIKNFGDICVNNTGN